MKPVLTLLFLVIFTTLKAQSTYSGVIGQSPVEFITDMYSDGVADAVYVYNTYDQPILIQGELKNNTLTLFEKDKSNKKKASLVFPSYDPKSSMLEGTWTDVKTKKELPIRLTKQFDLDTDENVDWKEREIIQSAATEKYYFKLVIRKFQGDLSPRVTGIHIYEKKTDKLIQALPLDCQLMSFNNTSIGDYNFDGLTDFSVFEGSYTGANTSSLYFLYDPKTKTFVSSGYTGTSLEFNPKTKRILERNSCCAGSQETLAIYKVVNNKMVLVEEHCYKWDDKKNKLVERKMKECQ